MKLDKSNRQYDVHYITKLHKYGGDKLGIQLFVVVIVMLLLQLLCRLIKFSPQVHIPYSF